MKKRVPNNLPVASTGEQPPAGMPASFNNLPTHLTPFIGRRDELAEVGKLIQNPNCRLLTLTGSGGIGKTRIAIEAARQAAFTPEAFSDGVYYISLTSLTSPEFILPALAVVLKMAISGQSDLLSQIGEHLKNRRALLLFDNFEHLLDGAQLLPALLSTAPEIQILATSRERLNVQGEWGIEIHSMRYPTLQETRRVESFSAVQLFLQGARQAVPGFSLGEQDRYYVAQICHFVGGMPLGIELAAAWVKTLSLKEIADAIQQNLDFLGSAASPLSDRPSSLRAVFEQSWGRLSQRDQEVFSKLAIFQGGFRREAASQVADAPLPVLMSLMDKSLIRRTAQGRYEIHEVLRQYAWDKISSATGEVGEGPAVVQAKHCAYFTDFLFQREEDLKGGRVKEALEEIGEEIENLRTAWSWAEKHARWEDIDRALDALYRFYDTRSWFQEGEEVLDATVKSLIAATSGEMSESQQLLLARLYSRQGMFCQRLGLYDEARHWLDQSIPILRSLSAPAETALALNYLGNVIYRLGDYAMTARLYEESLALYVELENIWGRESVTNNLGNTFVRLGNYEKAHELYEESLLLACQAGNRPGIARVLNNLANLAGLRGEHDVAEQYLRECLVAFEELNDRMGIASTLQNMGEVAVNRKEYDLARERYSQSLAIRREISHHWGVIRSLLGLGKLAVELGQKDEAHKFLEECLEISEHSGNRSEYLECLEVMKKIRP